MKASSALLSTPGYNPDRLLDAVQSKLRINSDAALSRALGVAPPILSKVRHRKVPITPWLIIQIHDAARLSVEEIRALMGAMPAAQPVPDTATARFEAGGKNVHCDWNDRGDSE
ncbi:MAG TPA: hypothetical protein VF798_17325 [Burkholderiaceae bacterium]